MNLNEEQLKEIEIMASLGFGPVEIAINIEVNPDDFTFLLKTEQGAEFSSFMRGRLKTEMELRTAILQSATNGSTPAQQAMRDYFEESRL